MKGQRVDFRRGAVIEEGFFYRRNLFKGVEGRSKVNSKARILTTGRKGSHSSANIKQGWVSGKEKRSLLAKRRTSGYFSTRYWDRTKEGIWKGWLRRKSIVRTAT